MAGPSAQQRQPHQQGGGTTRGPSRGNFSTVGASSTVGSHNDTIQRQDFMRTPDPGVSG